MKVLSKMDPFLSYPVLYIIFDIMSLINNVQSVSRKNVL